MGKGTVGADFNRPAFLLNVAGIARTALSVVQRTIAEQAVKLRQSLMARKKLARCVLKKTMRIFHPSTSPFSADMPQPSPQNEPQRQDSTDNTGVESP